MTLKDQLGARAPLLGTFLKTPSSMIAEVLVRTDLDLVCIDAEHAPFDRRDIDACIHAFVGAGKPVIVRVPANAPEHILNALDCGATGILAPHVRNGEDARRLASDCKYGSGRGYAGSSRAARYGARTMREHITLSNAATCVIAQIEDAEALPHLADIFSVSGIDAFFIGRADLAVSMGADSPDDPRVIDAVTRICRQGVASGVCIGMFTANLSEIAGWREQGASLFLLGSDHGFLLSGARALSESVRRQF
ncbi:MAG: aldolase [Alphaproteobacteria bacterium]|nr:aldolase [Alphaproteobacteria bacterium]